MSNAVFNALWLAVIHFADSGKSSVLLFRSDL